MSKLKILELFGGIGACSKALEKLGIDYEIADYVEIDKYAVKSFNAIHNTNFEPQDITKWDKDIDVDLIMHGSPCFLKGELVNTKEGFKKIEEIKIGDCVKSHDGTYNKVIQTMVNKNNFIYDINCSASHNINTTFNHPFYVLRNNQPQYIEVKDLTKNDYMIIPINKNENEIEWNGVKYNYNNRIEVSNKLPFDKKEFWYLIGRFIGDGWVMKRKDRNNSISGIRICCGKHELDEFKCKLNNVLPYTLVEERTVYKLHFSNKELGVFCEQFGKGAKNKQIPQSILDLKKEYLYPLLDGIIDSDGCFTNNKYQVTSISKKLIYNIGELVLKLYNIPYHIYASDRPKTYIIENRIVNQNKTYQITWGGNINESINYVDNDYLYSRIRKIESREELHDVYNIEVENTHSYCVYNIATHNCQDFSLAGKQAGGDKDSGTRSSLMYETIRIVEKLKPKYVIWENVKNLLSKKHRHNFDAYLETMEQLGYVNYYQVLNAKDYGIPQNRERVFTVSILGNENYEFPKGNVNDNKINKLFNFSARQDCRVVYNYDGLSPTLVAGMGEGGGKVPMFIEEKQFEFPPKQELKLKLKDMLEDEVDEKYYLSDKMIKYISASNEKWTGNNNESIINKSIASTINTGEGQRRCDASNYISNNLPRKYGIFDAEKSTHQAGSVYDKERLSPTLDTMQGGWRQPCIEEKGCVEKHYQNFIDKNGYIPEMFNPYNESEIKDVAPTQSTYCNSTTSSATVLIKNATKKGYQEAHEGDGINISSRMKYQRGNVQKESIQTLTTSGGNDRGVVLKSECKRLNQLVENTEFEEGKVLNLDLYNQTTNENISQCLTEPHHNSQRLFDGLRIRKLTPKECWRLMGFDDEDFEKAEKVNSNTQLYKQAGNSIVVNVLEAILENLLDCEDEDWLD